MATAPAPRPRSGATNLKSKVGPLPIWAWTLIGITGGYLGIRWYRNRQQAAKATQTSTTTAVPASSSPLPYNGLDAGIGGAYGGGSGGGSTPWTTPPPAPTPPAPMIERTPESNQAAVPLAGPLSAPAPAPVPAVPLGIQPSYLQGLGLTPDQISGVLQPQNQPWVNPNVSPAPTIALQPGASLGPATGVGQRLLTPGPNPFPVTYG